MGNASSPHLCWREPTGASFENRCVVRSPGLLGDSTGEQLWHKMQTGAPSLPRWQPEPQHPGLHLPAPQSGSAHQAASHRGVDRGDLETNGLYNPSGSVLSEPFSPLCPCACPTGEGSSRCPGGAHGLQSASLGAAVRTHSFGWGRFINAQFRAGTFINAQFRAG